MSFANMAVMMTGAIGRTPQIMIVPQVTQTATGAQAPGSRGSTAKRTAPLNGGTMRFVLMDAQGAYVTYCRLCHSQGAEMPCATTGKPALHAHRIVASACLQRDAAMQCATVLRPALPVRVIVVHAR